MNPATFRLSSARFVTDSDRIAAGDKGDRLEACPTTTRRHWLAACGTAGLAAVLQAAAPRKAQIAITFDLEMSRNFPNWGDTHWDYEKGNLDETTKRYAVEAARRVKAAGGLLHCFAVGRVCEQENIDWLREIVQQGHPLGNHTYDHVNVTANRVEDVQFRFRRAPWLVAGKSPEQIIRENIRLCTLALESRLGIRPVGFRTPGGFSDGLRSFPEIRTLLREQGFNWVSSLYPSHANTDPMQEPNSAVIDSIVAAQRAAQPFVYHDGLIEIPMSPISDIGAFRTGRWKLSWFLRAIRAALDWVITERAVFDFLGHPSCLSVVDPEFKSVELICQTVQAAPDRAELVDLQTIADRARPG